MIHDNEDSPELNSAESVYGFAAWLLCREDLTIISKFSDPVDIDKLVRVFCTENDLPLPTPNWTRNLRFPKSC